MTDTAFSVRVPAENLLEQIPFRVRDTAGQALNIPRELASQISTVATSNPVDFMKTLLSNAFILGAIASSGDVEIVTGVVGQANEDGEMNSLLEQIAADNFFAEGSRVFGITNESRYLGDDGEDNDPLVPFTVSAALFLPSIDEDGNVRRDRRSGPERYHFEPDGGRGFPSEFDRLWNLTVALGTQVNIPEFLQQFMGESVDIRHANSLSVISTGRNRLILGLKPGVMDSNRAEIAVSGVAGYGGYNNLSFTSFQVGPVAVVSDRTPDGGSLLSLGTQGGVARRLSGYGTALTVSSEYLSNDSQNLEAIRQDLLTYTPTPPKPESSDVL